MKINEAEKKGLLLEFENRYQAIEKRQKILLLKINEIKEYFKICDKLKEAKENGNK